MSSFAKPVAAAVALIAVVAIGCTSTSNNDQGDGSQPTPTPSPAATSEQSSSPNQTASPTPTASPTGLALTETFTSAIHGMSVDYPAGSTVESGSGPWTAALPGSDDPPSRDTIYITEDQNHFIGLASQPLAGRTGAQWIAGVAGLPDWEDSCDTADNEPVTVDGATGTLTFCAGRPLNALVADDGRGYFIVFYGSDDRDSFREILDTVQLQPERAVHASDSFSIPFTFRLPADPLFDYDEISETFFEATVHEYAEAGEPLGVIVEATGGGREDPCSATSAALSLGDGGQSVFDYLQTVSDLAVSNVASTTVGSLPAVEGNVVATTETSTCDEIRLWMNDSSPFTEIPRGVTVRMVAADVGGEHVVFTVYGENDDPGRRALVDELINSFEFETAGP